MGWKSDTYREQIKEFAKAMFNITIVVYYKKDPPTGTTTSRKAFKSTIANKVESSHS